MTTYMTEGARREMGMKKERLTPKPARMVFHGPVISWLKTEI